jgi:hypothetical protein
MRPFAEDRTSGRSESGNSSVFKPSGSEDVYLELTQTPRAKGNA